MRDHDSSKMRLSALHAICAAIRGDRWAGISEPAAKCQGCPERWTYAGESGVQGCMYLAQRVYDLARVADETSSPLAEFVRSPPEVKEPIYKAALERATAEQLALQRGERSGKSPETTGGQSHPQDAAAGGHSHPSLRKNDQPSIRKDETKPGSCEWCAQGYPLRKGVHRVDRGLQYLVCTALNGKGSLGG